MRGRPCAQGVRPGATPQQESSPRASAAAAAQDIIGPIPARRAATSVRRGSAWSLPSIPSLTGVLIGNQCRPTMVWGTESNIRRRTTAVRGPHLLFQRNFWAGCLASFRREDLCRSPDGDVPQRVTHQPRGIGQQALALRVSLDRRGGGQFLSHPRDQAVRRRPLAHRLAGLGRDLQDIPEPGVTARRRLAEVDIGRIEGLQRTGHIRDVQPRPGSYVADSDHVALLEQPHGRIQHGQLSGYPGVLHCTLPNRSRAGRLLAGTGPCVRSPLAGTRLQRPDGSYRQYRRLAAISDVSGLPGLNVPFVAVGGSSRKSKPEVKMSLPGPAEGARSQAVRARSLALFSLRAIPSVTSRRAVMRAQPGSGPAVRQATGPASGTAPRACARPTRARRSRGSRAAAGPAGRYRHWPEQPGTAAVTESGTSRSWRPARRGSAGSAWSSGGRSGTAIPGRRSAVPPRSCAARSESRTA